MLKGAAYLNSLTTRFTKKKTLNVKHFIQMSFKAIKTMSIESKDLSTSKELLRLINKSTINNLQFTFAISFP